MDSGFEEKQNRVLVMTRNGIYMYISGQGNHGMK